MTTDHRPSPSYWDWVIDNKFQFASLIGSFASVVGLAIVLLDKITPHENYDSDMLPWRILFFCISINGIAFSIIFTWFWISDTFNNDYSPQRKIVSAFFRFCVGAFLFSLALDGLFAVLQWRVWLTGPILLVIRMFHL